MDSYNVLIGRGSVRGGHECPHPEDLRPPLF